MKICGASVAIQPLFILVMLPFFSRSTVQLISFFPFSFFQGYCTAGTSWYTPSGVGNVYFTAQPGTTYSFALNRCDGGFTDVLKIGDLYGNTYTTSQKAETGDYNCNSISYTSFCGSQPVNLSLSCDCYASPSTSPTEAPTLAAPTPFPTSKPTAVPTALPTLQPTV